MAEKSYRGFVLKGIIIISLLSSLIIAYFSSAGLVEKLNVDSSLGTMFSGIINYWFLLIIPITLFNITARYIRWVFLLRAFGVMIPSKELFSTYLISYVGNFFPFHLPYLIRLIPLKNSLFVGLVILILDVAVDVLSIMLLFYLSSNFVVIAVSGFAILLVCIIYISMSRKSGSASFVKQAVSVIFAFALTVIVWLITSTSLQLSLMSFGGNITMEQSVNYFANSLYSGSLSYVPAGISITGMSIIDNLVKSGIPVDISVYSAIINRALTFWLVIIIAVFSYLSYYRFKKRSSAEQNHFDNISGYYQKIIPDHVQDIFIGKKMKINLEYLPQDRFKKGLDAGCGQGWYIREMAGEGYDINGIDYSAEQVEFAKNNTGLGGDRITRASITELPYEDSSLDFAYAINIIHHLSNFEEQKKAFREIYRILKPGGRFIIHEMNILNPLFRFYLGYVFPIIKDIDEGTEMWLKSNIAPELFREVNTVYKTFIPDFTPAFLLPLLTKIERKLEENRFCAKFSAHISIILEKK